MTASWENLGASARTVYSQYGEEGILEAIFELIGTTNKHLVDIGAGNGYALSNTRLFLGNGWTGSCFDCQPSKAAGVHCERVTAENVCELLKRHQTPHEFDLLSIDIDGIDWYVLRALLREYMPRVFVAEVNPCIAAEPPIVIEYNPGHAFNRTNYFGGSLGAFQRLGTAKGYTLAYVHESINAFFVRSELVPRGLHLGREFRRRSSWPPDSRRLPWRTISEADCQ